MNLFKRTALLALAASAIIPSVAVARPSNAPGQGRTGCTSEAINPMFPNTRQVVAWYSWHDRENNQWHWDINMNQDALAACRRQLASASTPVQPHQEAVLRLPALSTVPDGPTSTPFDACDQNGHAVRIGYSGARYQTTVPCVVVRVASR